MGFERPGADPITGANAGGPRDYATRARRPARTAPFSRWAAGQVTRSRKPQRGDMFIARDNQNHLKPRRGDMVLARAGHAAPTGLEEIIRGTVTTDMSLLRSWSARSPVQRPASPAPGISWHYHHALLGISLSSRGGEGDPPNSW